MKISSHSLSLSTLFGGLLFLALGTGNAHAQTIYIVGNSNQFGSFDLSTRVYTQITANLGAEYGGLAYNPSNGTLYSSSRFISGNPLVTISTIGIVTNIGDTGIPSAGLAFRPSDSVLFDYDFNFDRLGTVNTSNGVYTNLGNLGIFTTGVGGRISFLNNTLYLAALSSPSGLYSLNQSTGAANFIGFGSSAIPYVEMDAIFSAGNTLYGITSQGGGSPHTLYSINTASGALTSLGTLSGSSQPNFIRGAAASISSASAPEPGTLAFLALGGTLVLVRRRRVRSPHA